MTDHTDNEQDLGTYLLPGSDGQTYKCQVLKVFDFEDNPYAVLFRLEPPDDQGMFVMRVTTTDGDASFEVIESDGEFDRVIEYLHELGDAEAERHEHLNP